MNTTEEENELLTSLLNDALDDTKTLLLLTPVTLGDRIVKLQDRVALIEHTLEQI